MYINENELRGIIREEMTRTGVSRRIREATAAPAAGAQKHTVVKGDTLWALSKKYYADPFLWKNIYGANKAVIGADPNVIKPGMVLTIPAKSAATAPPAPIPKPGPPGPTPPGPPKGKGKQCELASYQDSLTQAFAKMGASSAAQIAAIDIIVMGKFYSATADGLSKIAASLQTMGSESLLKSAAAVWANAATLGGSEFLRSVIIAFCNGWASIINGCTNAKVKFSRTCDFTTFATEIGAAWGSGLSQLFAPVKGGIQAVLKFLTDGAEALAKIVASVGLVALGLTADVIMALIKGIAKMIQMGAAAVQAAISGAIITAGKVLSGAGAAVSAVGGGMQAAGGAVQKAGAAMNEGRSRNRLPKSEVMQKFADDLLHAARINRYLASLDESTRNVILRAAI